MLSSLIKFFTHNRFRKEITLVILLKLIALFFLWKFFLTPIDKDILAAPALIQYFTS